MSTQQPTQTTTEDQAPPETERARFTAGLRRLADLLDADPDLPLPYHGGNTRELSWIETGWDTERQRLAAARFAAAVPDVTAYYRDDMTDLIGAIGGVRVMMMIPRGTVDPAELGIPVGAACAAGCGDSARRRDLTQYSGCCGSKCETRLAEAERSPVDYRVQHGAGAAVAVRQALRRFGVEPIATDEADPAEVPTVTGGDDPAGGWTLVETGDIGYNLPHVDGCVSVDAYAEAIALWVKGTAVEDIPCPARPTTALRGMHHNGSVVTTYICDGCANDAEAGLAVDGYHVLTLDAAVPILTGPEIACGLRVEMAGAR